MCSVVPSATCKRRSTAHWGISIVFFFITFRIFIMLLIVDYLMGAAVSSRLKRDAASAAKLPSTMG